MNTISVYHQGLYTEINLSNTIFESISQALPGMFLTIVGMAKVVQPIKALSAIKDKFPNWKYFIREFEQYINKNQWEQVWYFSE